MKLKAKHYSDLVTLLKDAKLVEGNRAYPERIFVNPKTYKKIRAAIYKVAKKQYSVKNHIANAAEFYLLNYGPVEREDVREGYAFIIPLTREYPAIETNEQTTTSSNWYKFNFNIN